MYFGPQWQPQPNFNLENSWICTVFIACFIPFNASFLPLLRIFLQQVYVSLEKTLSRNVPNLDLPTLLGKGYFVNLFHLWIWIYHLCSLLGHLCFTITEKEHMIVPDWYNRILSYTKTYSKNKVFQLKWHENLIQYCLVVDLKQTWTVEIFWSGKKYAIFGSILAV